MRGESANKKTNSCVKTPSPRSSSIITRRGFEACEFVRQLVAIVWPGFMDDSTSVKTQNSGFKARGFGFRVWFGV